MLCEQSAVFHRFFVGAFAEFVQGKQAVCNRFGSHGVHAALNARIFIRNAHCIKLSRYFLRSQFLGKILDTQNLVFRIRNGEYAVQFQLAVNTQLHRHCLHSQRSTAQIDFATHIFPGFLFVRTVRTSTDSIIVYLNFLHKFTIDTTDTALEERRGEVRLQACICPAFGYHTFSHISYRINIEMRQSAYQPVGPVVTTQSNLLFRRKFQTAMSTEVNQRIGLKTELRPQIRCNISVRRCGIRTMNNLKRIVSLSGGILRQQHHIPEL